MSTTKAKLEFEPFERESLPSRDRGVGEYATLLRDFADSGLDCAQVKPNGHTAKLVYHGLVMRLRLDRLAGIVHPVIVRTRGGEVFLLRAEGEEVSP